MKAAFSTWRGSIAPLFDEAREILLVDVHADRTTQESTLTLAGALPMRRALELEEMGVRLLVCGAISNPVREALEANGIRVIPFVSGEVRELVRAWLDGSLRSDRYCMPGCGRRRRYRRGCSAMKGEGGGFSAVRGGGSQSVKRRRRGAE